MDTVEQNNNIYLAIAFINGCIWGGILVWIYPKAAIWLGMGVVILTYNVLRFFGNANVN